jgi:hypothetical protein
VLEVADPTDDGIWKWALGGLATFCAGVIAWILRRQSIREDRDFETRKDFTVPLAELPGRLDALKGRIDRLERRVDGDG